MKEIETTHINFDDQRRYQTLFTSERYYGQRIEGKPSHVSDAIISIVVVTLIIVLWGMLTSWKYFVLSPAEHAGTQTESQSITFSIDPVWMLIFIVALAIVMFRAVMIVHIRGNRALEKIEDKLGMDNCDRDEQRSLTDEFQKTK